MKNRAVANLSQRRRADRERAFFLPFFRFRGFGLIENETRIAKLPRVTRRPTRGATEQKSAEPAQHVLSTRAVASSTTKRQHYPMSQYTSTSELESRFTFPTLLRRERRRTEPERTFFLSVSVRSRIRTRHGLRNSALTCHVHARRYSANFSHFSFHTCGGET